MSCGVYERARALMTRGRNKEQGAAALEFALVSPLLFALIFGIIGYGYMLSFRQGISQGAAEGARAAAVEFNSANQSTVALAALNRSLSSYGVSCVGTSLIRSGETVGSCSVTIAACTNNATKECASVRVNYAYRDHPLLPSFPGLGGTMPEELDYTAVAEVS
jgi:Flp pilus assembly protein TadG